MEGSTEEANRMGMIPRAVQQIFESANLLKSKGWSYAFEAHYIEIYNETIRDLVGGPPGPNEVKKYEIKHHLVTGRTTVTDVVVGKNANFFFLLEQ
jgi:kinesin family member C1